MASGGGRLACYLGIRGRDGARPSDPAREQRYKCQPAVSARPARTGPPLGLGLCSGKNRNLLKIDDEQFA